MSFSLTHNNKNVKVKDGVFWPMQPVLHWYHDKFITKNSRYVWHSYANDYRKHHEHADIYLGHEVSALEYKNN